LFDRMPPEDRLSNPGLSADDQPAGSLRKGLHEGVDASPLGVACNDVRRAASRQNGVVHERIIGTPLLDLVGSEPSADGLPASPRRPADPRSSPGTPGGSPPESNTGAGLGPDQPIELVQPQDHVELVVADDAQLGMVEPQELRDLDEKPDSRRVDKHADEVDDDRARAVLELLEEKPPRLGRAVVVERPVHPDENRSVIEPAGNLGEIAAPRPPVE
jgi:hypothetical protein